MSIDNSLICDFHIDLGLEDAMFAVLGGNGDNCMSLGYLSDYDASLHPYCCLLYTSDAADE